MFTSNKQMEAFVRDMTPEMLKGFIEAIMTRVHEDPSISKFLGYEVGKMMRTDATSLEYKTMKPHSVGIEPTNYTSGYERKWGRSKLMEKYMQGASK